jgi:hypothetical protein
LHMCVTHPHVLLPNGKYAEGHHCQHQDRSAVRYVLRVIAILSGQPTPAVGAIVHEGRLTSLLAESRCMSQLTEAT